MSAEPLGKRLTAPSILLALIAVAASQGIPALTAALVFLPLAAAVLAVTSGWWGGAMICAAAGAACFLVMPSETWVLTTTWCILTAVIPLIKVRKPLHRAFLWAGMCAVAWIGGVAILLSRLDGPLISGLAQAACDWVEQSPQRNTILMNAYSMGYSRLEGTAALIPAIRVMGSVVIADETRLQMLYSLRVSLEEMLPSLICKTIVYHAAITALLCAVLPDWRRRKRGEHGELPPMEKWYIPRGLGLAIFLLSFGWLIGTMSTGGADRYFGWLCWAVFKAAYLIQGLCLMLWFEKKMGIRSAIRNIWAVALSILVPVIPVMMGMVDQRRDARHLRPTEEVE